MATTSRALITSAARTGLTATKRSKPAHRQPVDSRFLNLPNEPVPGEVEPWEAVEPIRPDTAHSRSLRFLDIAGELFAAVAIIGGGMVLIGFASLL
ncbi:hypothetical protein MKL09_05145 [Methylobacterium sp. J-048]|uniref:hypothetical protein n=1 Tax=Methylobacterium sp. J-048 TaxID=2836635 RepID=UPI001FB917AC|nr:hypothetical protein [Methylobacterium sp. J-048]MCJ2055935.1 hypothetical protein [Methylobacterium sp. J-048]